MKKLILLSMVLFAFLFSGCASVKMDSAEASNAAKQFSLPQNGKAGIYIYRDSSFGGSLTKQVYINNNCIGTTATNVFLYEQVDGDKEYKISTQSEFSNNDLSLKVESGKNYFIRQYIKMGFFVGRAELELVNEEDGKAAISKLNMAQKGNCIERISKEQDN